MFLVFVFAMLVSVRVRFVCIMHAVATRAAFELNNLDNDALDAPIYPYGGAGAAAAAAATNAAGILSASPDFMSLPLSAFDAGPITSAVAASGGDVGRAVGPFGVHRPQYQSAKVVAARPTQAHVVDAVLGTYH